MAYHNIDHSVRMQIRCYVQRGEVLQFQENIRKLFESLSVEHAFELLCATGCDEKLVRVVWPLYDFDAYFVQIGCNAVIKILADYHNGCSNFSFEPVHLFFVSYFEAAQLQEACDLLQKHRQKKWFLKIAQPTMTRRFSYVDIESIFRDYSMYVFQKYFFCWVSDRMQEYFSGLTDSKIFDLVHKCGFPGPLCGHARIQLLRHLKTMNVDDREHIYQTSMSTALRQIMRSIM